MTLLGMLLKKIGARRLVSVERFYERRLAVAVLHCCATGHFDAAEKANQDGSVNSQAHHLVHFSNTSSVFQLKLINILINIHWPNSSS